MEEQAIVKKWFKDHVARLESFTDQKGLKIETLYFANPICGMYWMRYYQHGGFLMIIGDLGEAVHKWDEVVDLHWMSQTSFSYFMDKMRAGREPDGKAWDTDKATRRLAEFFESEKKEFLSNFTEEEASHFANISASSFFADKSGISRLIKEVPANRKDYWTKFVESVPEAIHSLYTREQWIAFLDKYGTDLFRDDFAEYAGIGMKHTINHLAHWMGLSLAFEALKNRQL